MQQQLFFTMQRLAIYKQKYLQILATNKNANIKELLEISNPNL